MPSEAVLCWVGLIMIILLFLAYGCTTINVDKRVMDSEDVTYKTSSDFKDLVDSVVDVKPPVGR